MSDNDLIRRGDVREALREVDAWTMPTAHAINSLPAVTVDMTNVQKMHIADPASLLKGVRRYSYHDYDEEDGFCYRENEVLAALSRALIHKPQSGIEKGGDAHAVDSRHAPHEASPGVTAGAIREAALFEAWTAVWEAKSLLDAKNALHALISKGDADDRNQTR